jgi:hypothetical protein
MSVTHLEYARTNLRQFVAARVGFHLRPATVISHMQAARLLFFGHFLPRQSAGKDRHGKHNQCDYEANGLAERHHTAIVNHFMSGRPDVLHIKGATPLPKDARPTSNGPGHANENMFCAVDTDARFSMLNMVLVYWI